MAPRGTAPWARAVASVNLLAPVAVVALSAGCEIVTDFRLTPLAETSSELCSDGRDNDFNGFTDCQDWSCTEQLPCCDIRELIVADDFEPGPACASAACTSANCAALQCGPDSDIWHTWPCPYPKVCDGALHLDKAECFDAGVLSRSRFSLQPGLRIEVDLTGAPESRGYFAVILTIQDESDLPGSMDSCGSRQSPTGFAVAKQVASASGYRIEAQYRNQTIGTSPEISTADSSHTVSIGLLNDRRVSFALDGVTFVESETTVPVSDQTVRLALSGITRKVAVEAVRVYAGLRCRTPGTFALAGETPEEAEVLAGVGVGTPVWDSDEVFYPSVLESGTRRELYYTGCQMPSSGAACTTELAIGRAVSIAGGPFLRESSGAVVTQDVMPTIVVVRYDFQLDASLGVGRCAYLAPGGPYPMLRFDPTAVDRDDMVVSTTLETTRTGWDWDADSICCPSVLDRDGVIYLWYAGSTTDDSSIDRIGLATSTDGINFTRHPSNPVFTEGSPEDFDGAYVTSPAVVYDAKRALYQMWYEGVDYFGVTSIGFAVSVDGVTWSRAPANPVVTAESVGLLTVGGPAAIVKDDGRVELYVHGTTTVGGTRAIYLLENDGKLIDQ